MIRNTILILFLGLTSLPSLSSQSFYFGPKVGPVLGLQQWNNFQRDPLLALQGALFIESHTEGSNSSLFAQVGYMPRGSAIRVIDLFQNGISFGQSFRFNNLSLVLGGKRLLSMESKFRPYYGLGVRVEYTLSTNLSEYDQYNSYLFYPIDLYVNKLNYGVSLSGGFETNFSELVGGALEFTVSPDFSKQYEQPALNVNAKNPYTGLPIVLRERSIRNLSFEVSLVFRFLRKIEYID